MMPTQPAATPAPIHDITGPVSFLSTPLWMVIVGAIAFLVLAGFVVWLTRRKRTRKLTPKERAMAAIAELRKAGADTDSYAFGVKVSDALRAYIRDQHGLDAITRTSVEFLESLRTNPAFTDNEKAAISEFLESVDLLKYARVSASPADIETLLEIAERLVRGEKPTPAVPAK